MATIERIEQTDSGKVALEKLDRNDAALNKELESTTSKTDILCTANAGYKILKQNNTQINNVIYYNVIVCKNDDSVFPTNTTLTVVTIPVGARPTTESFGSFCGLIGSQNSGVGTCAIIPNGSVQASTQSSNVTQFRLNWVVVL